MEDKLWKDYPELTNEYRTPEEDMLSDEIVALFEKIYKYLKTFETNDVPILDLQGLQLRKPPNSFVGMNRLNYFKNNQKSV